jgi:hypothetical protein
MRNRNNTGNSMENAVLAKAEDMPEFPGPWTHL